MVSSQPYAWKHKISSSIYSNHLLIGLFTKYVGKQSVNQSNALLKSKETIRTNIKKMKTCVIL